MNPFVLRTDEQATLFRLARRAIEEAVGCRSLPAPAPALCTALLRAPHAAFVTLKKYGDLRGCIGCLDFNRSLWENVDAAARASALEDTRFNPVEPWELELISLEISVLEQPFDLPRLEDFHPQEHGIIIQNGNRRALLLPKVAQELGWGADQVLEALCEKAGLPKDAWQSAKSQLQIFTAYDFAEPQSP